MEQNKQQTAVEWLLDILVEHGYFKKLPIAEYHKAKAMEKEQIKAAYNQGYTEVEHDCCPTIGPDISLFSNAEDYYNETYKEED